MKSVALITSFDSHNHPKGRDCARTDEVLENYRLRAIRAELELARITKESE